MRSNWNGLYKPKKYDGTRKYERSVVAEISELYNQLVNNIIVKKWNMLPSLRSRKRTHRKMHQNHSIQAILSHLFTLWSIFVCHQPTFCHASNTSITILINPAQGFWDVLAK